MRTVLDLLGDEIRERVFHVGRLDLLSSGLIFYTTDGDFANIVMHPSHGVEKEYHLIVREELEEKVLEEYREGIEIDGSRYRAEACRLTGLRSACITLRQGKNREIRRVCAWAGLNVMRLERRRIGCVHLEGISRGEYRHLTPEEVAWFQALPGERRKRSGGA